MQSAASCTWLEYSVDFTPGSAASDNRPVRATPGLREGGGAARFNGDALGVDPAFSFEGEGDLDAARAG